MAGAIITIMVNTSGVRTELSCLHNQLINCCQAVTFSSVQQILRPVLPKNLPTTAAKIMAR
jgi:hypothetical protein